LQKKNTDFAAKVGFARLSKTVYNVAPDNNIVAVFKGATKMGGVESQVGILKTNPEYLSPRQTWIRFNIRDGDEVSLVISKK